MSPRAQPAPDATPEQVVLRRVSQLVGYVPVGMSDLLRVLAHPDVIGLTRAYLDTADWPSGMPKPPPYPGVDDEALEAPDDEG